MIWVDTYDEDKYIEEYPDYILAVGGDGTLINAVHLTLDLNKPIFGVAAGTVNFLMNESGLKSRKAKQMDFNLIDVEVTYYKGDEKIIEKVQAFNDVIIGEFNAWIEFNCIHGDNILGDFFGSGLLISTAQGSTGANKNNNGTILPLSSNHWSVTGVMTNRNINYVIESKKLEINTFSRGNIKIAVDGSHKVFNDVTNVKIKRGKKVSLIFNDIQKFKEKRQ